MLRYSFLPSDHNPMVLMLGEEPDMRMLSELLRRFSRSPQDVNLSAAYGFAVSDTEITLSAGEHDLGMHVVSRNDKILRWTLDSSTAELFAELVEELAEHDLKSGSERLICGDYREIPVKVSRGEFTDNYLVFGRGAAAAGPQPDRRVNNE